MSREYSALFDTDEGQEVLVTFDFTPGTPESGAYNCPPEDYDPGSAAELYITSVRLMNGIDPTDEVVKLTVAEIERFHEECDHGDWDHDYHARGEEYRAEQRADDLMRERWA